MKRLLTLLLCLCFLGCSVQVFPKVEKGDIWYYYGTPDNPFEEKEIRHKYKVLKVKGEWVKYEDLDTGEIKSHIIRWFISGSEKQEEK